MKDKLTAFFRPHFPDPLNVPEDIDNKLKYPVDVNQELGYVFDAITLTRKNLEGAGTCLLVHVKGLKD